MKLSIIISSHNRLSLFRRTLWSIAKRRPNCDFEVIVVDDESDQPILEELKLYSSQFPWKFIRFDRVAFEEATGLKKYHNNPCVTQNIGFKYSSGELIIQQGNEVIAWEGCYEKLLKDCPSNENFIIFSTTYDLPQQYLDILDQYGSNLPVGLIEVLKQWPLQSESYRSDVTNYISICNRSLWEQIEGFDERYYAGICAEDSDFVRRARALKCTTKVSDAISFHQYHGGKTAYYEPVEVDKDKFTIGCKINRKIYDEWSGEFTNSTPWKPGEYGVGEVITSGY